MQDAGIVGLENMSLLSDPAAKLIRMNVHVFSYCTLCVLESQILVFPTIGHHNWRTYGTNTDRSKTLILQPEKCNSFGTYCQVLSPLTSRSMFRNTSTGENPESFDESVMFMSMFNNIEWTKKGNFETCFAQCQRSGSFCDTIQARTLVIPGACVREDVVERKSQRTPRTMGH